MNPAARRYLVTRAPRGCRLLREALASPGGYGLPGRAADAVRELVGTCERGRLRIPRGPLDLTIDWAPAGDGRPGFYLVEIDDSPRPGPSAGASLPETTPTPESRR